MPCEKFHQYALLILIIFILTSPVFVSSRTITADSAIEITEEETSILAYRVFNASKIYAKEPVYLFLIIHNPTTWTLVNISFGMVIPRDVLILSIRNDSPLVFSSIRSVREGTNVTVSISYIGANTTFRFWVLIEFRKEKEYTFDAFTIYLTRVKGELIEKTSISCPSLTIDVTRRKLVTPPEGEIDMLWILFIALVIVPIGVALNAHRLIQL